MSVPAVGRPQPGPARSGPQQTVRADIGALVQRLLRVRSAALDPARRTVVGIAGPPGAGKSTLASALVARLGPRAVLVGMDGFHLAQQVLERHGTAAVKGAPHTFDATGYLALLARLRVTPRQTVYAPLFDRSIEEPIAGAVEIAPDVDIVVTEGNYLLLPTPAWVGVATLLDEGWYLEVPEHLRMERLISRHMSFGRSARVARERATAGSDGANAALVIASRPGADLVVTAD